MSDGAQIFQQKQAFAHICRPNGACFFKWHCCKKHCINACKAFSFRCSSEREMVMMNGMCGRMRIAGVCAFLQVFWFQFIFGLFNNFSNAFLSGFSCPGKHKPGQDDLSYRFA